MAAVFIVFPNHLFENTDAIKNSGISEIVMIEEPLHFYDAVARPYQYNQVKLAYMRASMKFYFKFLETKFKNGKFHLKYIDFNDAPTAIGLIKRGSRVVMHDPMDVMVSKKYADMLGSKLEVIRESPMFLMSPSNLAAYRGSPRHAPFYEYVKKCLAILPGVPNMDKMNRLNIPKTSKLPKQATYANAFTKEAVAYVRGHPRFSQNLGNAENCADFPCTHAQAVKACKMFVEKRLSNFGFFQDAIKQDCALPLYHSCLSACLNNGLLTPQHVVKQVLAYHKRHKDAVGINNVEGFLRQVVGWREWCRFIYVYHHRELTESNVFKNTRRLNWRVWTEGTNGVLPILDNEIRKAVDHGYAHHIVRLMVFLNLMVLSEVCFEDVVKWFMEVCAIDAWDWVMVSNIGGMGFFSSQFMTKPYLSTSNYFVKLSDYAIADLGSGAWESLFYRFLSTKKKKVQRYAGVYMRNLAVFERMSEKDKRAKLDVGRRALELLSAIKQEPRKL